MHSTSIATAIAIARLVDNAPPGLVGEAAAYVERARMRLALDNAALSAAMMFAQPLIKLWRPHWKFAYTVGLALGIKFTTEGFFLVDIVQHLTDEFSLRVLKEGEFAALKVIDWFDANRRCRSFHNALVSVALEHPLPGEHEQPAPQPTVAGQPNDNASHVLVVDDSALICQMHTALVQEIRPDARVHSCQTMEEAVSYVAQMDDAGTRVSLVLLDLNLTLPDEGVPPPTLDQVLASSNGFAVSEVLDEVPEEVPKDFRHKPFVAMVSYLAEDVMARAMNQELMNHDGSIRGCDALLSKPLNLGAVRVLIEGAGA